ncbi:MAG: hypothetical protein P8182_14520 [Deltaproteobacteria bacterium]
MERESQEQARRPAHYGPVFGVGASTFLTIFGLLLVGGLTEVGTLVNMLWRILGPG